PGSNQFTPTGDMAAPFVNCSGTLLRDGKVLFVGNGGGAQIYDPATARFSSIAVAEAPVMFPFETLLNDRRVLIAGVVLPLDRHHNDTTVATIYDSSSAAFTPAGTLKPVRRGYTLTTLLDGSVLLAGGAQGTPPKTLSDHAMLYCP